MSNGFVENDKGLHNISFRNLLIASEWRHELRTGQRTGRHLNGNCYLIQLADGG